MNKRGVYKERKKYVKIRKGVCWWWWCCCGVIGVVIVLVQQMITSGRVVAVEVVCVCVCGVDY